MKKGIFMIGTGTDVGKTYVTALFIKALRKKGKDVGYYKAVLSGADNIRESDAGYVNRIACIGQEESSLLSYLYQTPVSPHLAAKIEGNPPRMRTIKKDVQRVFQRYEYVVMEGSGGIVCPIRYDEEETIWLEDIIKEVDLPTVIVAEAGLGTINATVLTVEYLKQRGIEVKGIFFNRYIGDRMQKDNKTMIEERTKVPILSLIEPNATELKLEKEQLEILGFGRNC